MFKRVLPSDEVLPSLSVGKNILYEWLAKGKFGAQSPYYYTPPSGVKRLKPGWVVATISLVNSDTGKTLTEFVVLVPPEPPLIEDKELEILLAFVVFPLLAVAYSYFNE